MNVPNPDYALVFHFFEERGERPVAGNGESRGDFGQWQEDESALVEARMGQGEHRGLHLRFAVQKQIEIDGAWREPRMAAAATGRFNGKERIEQRRGGKAGIQGDDGVDVIGLRAVDPQRRTAVTRGTGEQPRFRQGREGFQNTGQGAERVAEIGPQADEGTLVGRHCLYGAGTSSGTAVLGSADLRRLRRRLRAGALTPFAEAARSNSSRSL